MHRILKKACWSLFKNDQVISKSKLQSSRSITTKHANTKINEANGVRKITLCNTQSRNALSLSMLDDLYESFTDGVENTTLRSIVLTAEGHVFSCGHDLKELKKEKGSEMHRKIFGRCIDLMNAIMECPVPVIAAVNGIATAAGCQLVAACDIAVCTTSSSFALPGASVGIFCSTPSVPVSRRLSRSAALHMLFTALPLSAEDAVKTGLVLKSVPAEELEKEVAVITDAINSKSRSVLQLGKKMFYAQDDMDIQTAYTHAESIMLYNLTLKDAQEGINGFLEKRKPVWAHSFDTDK